MKPHDKSHAVFQLDTWVRHYSATRIAHNARRATTARCLSVQLIRIEAGKQ